MDGDTAITDPAWIAGERGDGGELRCNEGLNTSAKTLGAPADGNLVLAVAAVQLVGGVALFSSSGPRPMDASSPTSRRKAWGSRSRGRLGDRLHHRQRDLVLVPLTAGVVALLVQANPSATVDQVFGALRSTASQSARPTTCWASASSTRWPRCGWWLFAPA